MKAQNTFVRQIGKSHQFNSASISRVRTVNRPAKSQSSFPRNQNHLLIAMAATST
jgi:hypothetical protein